MTSSPTQKHFDRIAADYYARNYKRPRSRHERGLALRRDVCLELLASVGARVLDMGCGPGALAVPLAIAGKSVVALDLSEGMVHAAEQQFREEGLRGDFCVADATRLPFADASFDAIVTTGVLEYVPDIDTALAEIARALRPDGALVATVSLPRTFERIVTKYVGPLVLRAQGKRSEPPPFHRAFGVDEFDALLVKNGLHVDARRFSYFAPFPFDALAPSVVTMIDARLGSRLQRSATLTKAAKTYVVRARRG